jgi:hypothetical protein
MTNPLAPIAAGIRFCESISANNSSQDNKSSPTICHPELQAASLGESENVRDLLRCRQGRKNARKPSSGAVWSEATRIERISCETMAAERRDAGQGAVFTREVEAAKRQKLRTTFPEKLLLM